MGMTMTQKILAAHAGLSEVKAGQLIEADLDLVLGNDITSPVAIHEMDKMTVKTVFDKDKIALEELKDYPCLSFDQGEYNSFYYAEEVLSTYEYKQLIKANDRATMLNLMVGLNGYTLCSGIICEELNGDNYCAVKLDSDERMEIGYISRKGAVVSAIGQKYLEEISKSRAL